MSSVLVSATPGKPGSLTDGFHPTALPFPLESSWRPDAPVAVLMVFVNLSLDHYDRLMAHLDLASRGSALPGCLFHWATGAAEGVRITEVWRSLKLFDFFLREDVLPTVTALRLPDPEISVFTVHHFLTEGLLGRDHLGTRPAASA